MSELISVPIETLRTSVEILLSHLQEIEGPNVRLDRDYFWAISPDQAYDVYNDPHDFTVGQLSECLSNLEAIVADPTRATSFALAWLGELLKAIGQSVVQ
jgi:hypothetical protein